MEIEKKFILVNDPDHGTTDRLRNVFDALNANNILITTAVFCTMGQDNSDLSRHCYRGETGALDEPAYRDLMLEQKAMGHEIAFHGYSQISNTREEFIEGLEIFRNVFGEYPFTYIEHGGWHEHHDVSGCKKERLDWMGSDKTSAYYIRDVVKEKTNCVWANFDLLDGPELWSTNSLVAGHRSHKDNLFPKKTEELFYTQDDILCFRRWRSYYLAQMYESIRQSKSCTFIGYTHFGYDFYATQGYIHDDWRTRESCFKAAEMLRKIMEYCKMENLTIQQIVERGLK